jgi:hypothetical protein
MNESKKQYDLIEVIELMKLHKVLKVQMGSLSVELSPKAYEKEYTPEEMSELLKEVKPDHIEQPDYQISAEEMLKIASPFPFK